MVGLGGVWGRTGTVEFGFGFVLVESLELGCGACADRL